MSGTGVMPALGLLLLIAVSGFSLPTAALPGHAITEAPGGPGIGKSEGVTSPATVPPFLDTTSGIIDGPKPFPDRPDGWPTSATVKERGAPNGGDIAKVRLRIEGKGDPIVQRLAAQTMVLLSHSTSMAQSDPAGARCDFTRRIAENYTAPDELGLSDYESTARLAVPIGTSYQQVANWAQCYALGAADVAAGLRTAIDSLVPEKKSGFHWVIVLVTDGNITGPDPVPEAERASQESVRVFVLCLERTSPHLCLDPRLPKMAQVTRGGFYIVHPSELPSFVEYFTPNRWPTPSSDVAGRPPKNGDAMIRFPLTENIEVVPESFRCISDTCIRPNPDAPPADQLKAGNRGAALLWTAPVRELRTRQVWEVEFSVRVHGTSVEVEVNHAAGSVVKYDRFDGSPGGSESLEGLRLKVIPKDDSCASGMGPATIKHVSPGRAPAGVDLDLSVVPPIEQWSKVCREYGEVVSTTNGVNFAKAVRVHFSIPGFGSGVYSMVSPDDPGGRWSVVIPGRLLPPGPMEYRIEATMMDGRIYSDPSNLTVEPYTVILEGSSTETRGDQIIPWADLLLILTAGAALGAVAGLRYRSSGPPAPIPRILSAGLLDSRRRLLDRNAIAPRTNAIRKAVQKTRKLG